MNFADSVTTDYSDLWRSIQQLLDEDRWHDAIVTLRAVANATNAAPVRLTLGTLLAEWGDLHGAVVEWTRLLDAAQLRGDRGSLSAVYHNLAAVYRELGDLELARRFQQRSLTFQEEHGPAELLQLANDALWKQEWDLADALLTLLDEAAPNFAAEESLKIETLATKGLLAGFRSQPAVGARLLRQAYHRHCYAGETQLAGRDLINLALLLDQRQQPGLGLRCLRQAERHCRACDDRIGHNRIRFLRAQLQRHQALRKIQPGWN